MSCVVDLVTSELLKEVKQEYATFGQLSDSILSALNCVFGHPLLSALDLVDRNTVTHITSPGGKEIYQAHLEELTVALVLCSFVHVCPTPLVSLNVVNCLCASTYWLFVYARLWASALKLRRLIQKLQLFCSNKNINVQNISNTASMMDAAAVLLLFVVALLMFVQMSTWPFIVNFVVAFLSVIAAMFCSVTNSYLFPVENLLMYFYKRDSDDSMVDNDITESSDSEATDSRVFAHEERFDDEVTRKLRELTGHIVRDFILEWYNTVSDDVHFVQQAFEVFEHILGEVRRRVSSVDAQRLLRALLSHLIRHYRCYKQAVECAGPLDKADSDRKNLLIALTYEKLNGHLAMSNLPDTEADHLRSLVAVLLKALLPNDFVITGTSMYLVRELIARNVLQALVDMLSTPAWINDAVARVLSDEENESRKNSKTTDADAEEPVQASAEAPETTTTIDCSAAAAAVVVDFKPQERSDPEDVAVRYSVSNESDAVKLDIQFLPHCEVDEVENFEHERRGGLPVADGDDSSEKVLDSHTVDLSLLTSRSVSVATSSSIGGDSVDSLAAMMPLDVSESHFADDRPTGRSAAAAECYVKVADVPKLEEEIEVIKTQLFKDEKPFKRIRIPEVSSREETLDAGNKYTLYKITYTARLPPPPKKKKKRFTSLIGRREEADPAQHADVSSEVAGRDEMIEFQAHRRFREFLTLQDRLNENRAVRRLVQNVKGPSRMFPMPIGNMDKEYIEKRRKFLQAYLRELCHFPAVCQSTEMREFLGYDSDPRLEFVRKQSDMIPRFDKLLKNAVQELIGTASNKLSGAFATDDSDSFYVPAPSTVVVPQLNMRQSQSLPHLLQTEAGGPSAGSMEHSQTQVFGPLPRSPGPVERFKNIMLGKSSSSMEGVSIREFAPFAGRLSSGHATFGRQWRSPENLIQGRSAFCISTSSRRTQGDGCDVYNRDPDTGSLSEWFVASQLFRLTRSVWGVSLGVNTLSFIGTARFVTEYVEMRVNSLIQKDRWLHYISILQETLWPGGVWKGNKSDQETTDTNLDKAQQALEEALPDALPFITGGHGPYAHGISELLTSFQNPIINRHLVYHLLDTALRLLFPDLQIVLSCRGNVSL